MSHMLPRKHGSPQGSKSPANNIPFLYPVENPRPGLSLNAADLGQTRLYTLQMSVEIWWMNSRDSTPSEISMSISPLQAPHVQLREMRAPRAKRTWAVVRWYFCAELPLPIATWGLSRLLDHSSGTKCELSSISKTSKHVALRLPIPGAADGRSAKRRRWSAGAARRKAHTAAEHGSTALS